MTPGLGRGRAVSPWSSVGDGVCLLPTHLCLSAGGARVPEVVCPAGVWALSYGLGDGRQVIDELGSHLFLCTLGLVLGPEFAERSHLPAALWWLRTTTDGRRQTKPGLRCSWWWSVWQWRHPGAGGLWGALRVSFHHLFQHQPQHGDLGTIGILDSMSCFLVR